MESLFQQIQDINIRCQEFDISFQKSQKILIKYQKSLDMSQKELHKCKDLCMFRTERNKLLQNDPPHEDLFELEKYDSRKTFLDKQIKSLSNSDDSKTEEELEKRFKIDLFHRNNKHNDFIILLSQITEHWYQGLNVISKISNNSQAIIYRPQNDLNMIETLKPTYKWLEKHKPVTCREKCWKEVFDKIQKIVYPISEQQYQYSKFLNFRMYLYIFFITVAGYNLFLFYLLIGFHYWAKQNNPSRWYRYAVWVQDDWVSVIFPEMVRTIEMIYSKLTSSWVIFIIVYIVAGIIFLTLGERFPVLALINWLIMWCCDKKISSFFYKKSPKTFM